MATADLAARVEEALAGEPRVLFVYLFGSVARGDARADSDVDLAVYLSGDATLEEESALQERLDAAIDGEVDLIILRPAPLWLQFRIVGEGHPLFVRDEAARVAFRARVEKEFLDFKPYHDAYLAAVRDRARRGVLSGG